MEDEAFAVSVNGFSLNLPANVSAFTPGLRDDLGRQVDSMSASMTSLARRCVARSEDVLPYFGRSRFYSAGSDDTNEIATGTEFVVRDIDYLARLIEGEDKRINCKIIPRCLYQFYPYASDRLGFLIWHRDRAIYG